MRKSYRVRKNVRVKTDNRKKIIFSGVVLLSMVIIGMGFYIFFSDVLADDSEKVAITLDTGDQLIEQAITITVNADGGLSLRADKSSTSNRLILIPNGTELTASEESDGWYRVTYDGQTGWISKEYTLLKAAATDTVDETADWTTFSSTAGYEIKYQNGWTAKGYGANTVLSASSVAAFSTGTLPTSLSASSDFIAPVTVVVSTKTLEELAASYAAIAGVTTETLPVGGVTATKYTYTSASTKTVVTAIIFSAGGKVFVMADGGGYAEDLLKMATTFTIN